MYSDSDDDWPEYKYKQDVSLKDSNPDYIYSDYAINTRNTQLDNPREEPSNNDNAYKYEKKYFHRKRRNESPFYDHVIIIDHALLVSFLLIIFVILICIGLGVLIGRSMRISPTLISPTSISPIST